MIFRDRVEAGKQLAVSLDFLRGESGAIVLGIPRGGVVVAAEVAATLGLPLDVWVSRKIGAPGNPEFAIGSVAETGEAELDGAAIRALGVSSDYLAMEIAAQRAEIVRRLRQYRGMRPPLELEGKTVVLVDDGLATGATARAALKSLRTQNPARLFLAVPVAPISAEADLAEEADRIIVLHTPIGFSAVGGFYESFAQVTDEEVIALMERGR
ncbi:MAG: putative phosphoribosyl transferase [Chthoniobacter sp.]|jgi:predicted phosphoribosyltransferase|nr:putative phosphoribosyl transferase [Chthoniobacter sp.]